MTYAKLIVKYPAYARLINRIDTLICGGCRSEDLLPDAYRWIEKRIDIEDRPAARARLEAFCRARDGGAERGEDAQTRLEGAV